MCGNRESGVIYMLRITGGFINRLSINGKSEASYGVKGLIHS